MEIRKLIEKAMTKEIENIIEHTLQYEGGYTSPIAGDKGGETMCGIARNYHPKWEGWKIVDVKKPLKYNQQVPELKPLVMDFYYRKFFLPSNCDEFIKYSIPLAGIIFDFAVHSGIGRAIKAYQQIINIQLKWQRKLSVDGVFGARSLEALEEDYIDFNQLAEGILDYRRAYLNSIATGSQKKFLKGWMYRIDKLRENYL